MKLRSLVKFSTSKWCVHTVGAVCGSNRKPARKGAEIIVATPVSFLTARKNKQDNMFWNITVHIWAAKWENRIFANAKTKTQISFAVTAKLISAFVFATRIVQSLFFLNTKFQALAIFCGCTAWFVSDLVGNPEDRFSHVVAHLVNWDKFYQFSIKCMLLACRRMTICGFWPGLTQTRLDSHWRWLEAWNFVFRK